MSKEIYFNNYTCSYICIKIYVKDCRRLWITLTKAELAQKLGEECGFMRGEATEIVEKLLNIIKSRLITGEDVMISGFGK